ncbi:hypothetical protein HG530_013801 [Fusarium avenaceum]|nr:hypothetical protein HG530_013801 [Fusarium avenaceum]
MMNGSASLVLCGSGVKAFPPGVFLSASDSPVTVDSSHFTLCPSMKIPSTGIKSPGSRPEHLDFSVVLFGVELHKSLFFLPIVVRRDNHHNCNGSENSDSFNPVHGSGIARLVCDAKGFVEAKGKRNDSRYRQHDEDCFLEGDPG